MTRRMKHRGPLIPPPKLVIKGLRLLRLNRPSSVIALVRAMPIALLKKDQDEDDENDESELD